jgi:hypothetical protein
MRNRWLRMLVVLATLTGAGAAAAFDVQKIASETQRSVLDGNDVSLVWWIPTEFWKAALDNQHVDSVAARPVLASLDQYLVFAIIRASSGNGGQLVAARTRDEIVVSSKLVVDGHAIDAVPVDALSPIAAALFEKFRPVMAQMLGSFGGSMVLVAYPAKVGEQTLVEATRPGQFSYTLYDQTFHWRLPLGSLLPPRVDTKTGEEFPGNYLFSPYTGEPLVLK